MQTSHRNAPPAAASLAAYRLEIFAPRRRQPTTRGEHPLIDHATRRLLTTHSKQAIPHDIEQLKVMSLLGSHTSFHKTRTVTSLGYRSSKSTRNLLTQRADLPGPPSAARFTTSGHSYPKGRFNGKPTPVDLPRGGLGGHRERPGKFFHGIYGGNDELEIVSESR